MNVTRRTPIHLAAGIVRYLAHRYLDGDQSSQEIARTNAAQASATLRERRHEQEDVDAYLEATLAGRRGRPRVRNAAIKGKTAAHIGTTARRASIRSRR